MACLAAWLVPQEAVPLGHFDISFDFGSCLLYPSMKEQLSGSRAGLLHKSDLRNELGLGLSPPSRCIIVWYLWSESGLSGML